MMRRCAAVLTIVAALFLSGCGADYGLDQDGRIVAAERLDKQWVVVNYWADWCTPCRAEVPELNALSKQLQGQGVTVVGVNFDNLQGEDLKKASDSLGIHFTVLAEDPAPRFDLPHSEALPVTYIIDDKGAVREQLQGEQTAAGIAAKLAVLKRA